jgi:hypothetical protein
MCALLPINCLCIVEKPHFIFYSSVGLLPDPHASPKHAPTAAALDALLTPPLASRLSAPNDTRLLSVLNGSGMETARVSTWGGGNCRSLFCWWPKY